MPKINIAGLNMYYEVAGKGDPLVLISGLSGDHLGWTITQVPAYTAAGYRCLVFDNRDVGQTDESPLASYTVRQFADDTAALLAQLALGPVHLLGASMGGMIAQEFALHYPAQIRSLTLVCTVPVVEPFLGHLIASWKTIRRQCTREAFLQMNASWLFTHRFYEDPEAVQLFMQRALANPFPQSVAAFLRQCEACVTHNALGRLGTITVPTYVIVGEEDILTPPRLARVLAEQLPGARLTVIPESGHGLFWEKATEFNQAVLDFLKDH